MTAEHPTFFGKGAVNPYLCLDNAGNDDAPQVNEFKEAGTTRCAVASSRFAITTKLVLFSLFAFVPGVQAEILLHKGDASIRHEQDFPASAAEGLFFSNAIDYHCSSLGTPDTTFKDDQIIDNLSTGYSLFMASATDKSDESRDAGIDAKESRLNSIPGAGATTTHLASFFQSAGETPSIFSTAYSTAAVRTTTSDLKKDIHLKKYSSPNKTLLSSTQATAMQRKGSEDTVTMKVSHISGIISIFSRRIYNV